MSEEMRLLRKMRRNVQESQSTQGCGSTELDDRLPGHSQGVEGGTGVAPPEGGERLSRASKGFFLGNIWGVVPPPVLAGRPIQSCLEA